MVSYAEYFSNIRYHPRYLIGDRVQVQWNGRVIVGTVGNDSNISEDYAPVVSVMLDSPVPQSGQLVDLIFCSHSQLDPLAN